MEIAYATSDLTAKGVDSYKYAACMLLSPAQRGLAACGDYEQTHGKMYFPEGSNSGGFTINIVNYNCARPYLKFIQVSNMCIAEYPFAYGGMEHRSRFRFLVQMDSKAKH
jgi:hypothetical protein